MVPAQWASGVHIFQSRMARPMLLWWNATSVIGSKLGTSTKIVKPVSGFIRHTSEPYRKRYGFLPDRIMNLELAFPGAYEVHLRWCIRSILALTPDFDWEPYLARTAGEQKLIH